MSKGVHVDGYKYNIYRDVILKDGSIEQLIDVCDPTPSKNELRAYIIDADTIIEVLEDDIVGYAD